LTFGYAFSNAVTIDAVCGAHAHTVSVVGCCSAAAMAAAPVLAADAVLLALAAVALAEVELLVELLELLQAARPAARARPAVATDAVAPAFRQLRVLVLLREFSCIVMPSTSLSTVR
jgi:hypothetical protein